MNTEEKEKQQMRIVANLKGIESTVTAAVKVKDAARAKIQDLNMNGMKTYSQEHVETEKQKIKNDLAVKMANANDDIEKRLDELLTLIRERDAVLDLGNPALANAFLMIQTIGAGLSRDQLVKINANVLHDQSSLNAIRDAYRAKGITNGGGIDELIYDAQARIDKLKNLAIDGTVRDGSINNFSNELAKLAELEGTTVEKLPDLQGLDMTINRAAGLSDKRA